MFRARLNRDVGFAVCICTAAAYAVFSGSKAGAQEAEQGAASPRSSLSDALRSFRIDSNDFGSRALKRDQNDKAKHSSVPGSAASLIVRATPAATASAASARAAAAGVARPLSSRASALAQPPHPVGEVAHAESACQVAPRADSTHQEMRKTSEVAPAKNHAVNAVAKRAPVAPSAPNAPAVLSAHVMSAALPHRHVSAHAGQLAAAIGNKSRASDNKLKESVSQAAVSAPSSLPTAGAVPPSEHPVAAAAAPPVVPAERHFAPLPGSGVEQPASPAASSENSNFSAVAGRAAAAGAAVAGRAAAPSPVANQSPSAPVRLLPVQMPVPVLYYSPAVVADNYKGAPAPADDGNVHAPFVDVTRNASGRKHVSVHLPFIHVEHDAGEQHTQVRAPFVNVDKAQGQPAYVRAPFTHVAPDATGQGTEVRAPLTHVAPNPGGQGTNVRAPFTSVNKTPGEPARVNAPFTKVQNDGKSGNVSVHAPFAKVEKVPGQPAQVRAPFTKVNSEPKNP